MWNSDETVDLCGTVIKETEYAFLIDIDDTEKHWIPKSQLIADHHSVISEGDHIVFGIPEWLAEEKGL
jgi:hypothetical protein